MPAKLGKNLITVKKAIDETRRCLMRFSNNRSRTRFDYCGTHLPLRIFTTSGDRALDFAERFLSEAVRLGCTIHDGEKETYRGLDELTGKTRPIYILNRGQAIDFEITERATRKVIKEPYGLNSHMLIPTGFLTFRYKGFEVNKNSWSEAPQHSLWDSFNEILAAIEPITDLLERYEKAQEEHRKVEEEHERFKARQQDLIDEAEANRQSFYKAFQQWEQLEKQADFIKSMKLLHSSEPPKHFGSWLEAANRYLDSRRQSIRPWQTFQGTTFDPADIKTDVLPDLE